jgi:hypothetical protein
MNKAKTQIRGICQCCGREQAVVGGFMSKHGYTVDHGWFEGVCQGQHYAPMEISRERADLTIEQVRADCRVLRVKADALRSRRISPASAKSGKRTLTAKGDWDWEIVAFSQAPAYYQQEAIDSEVYRAQRRAEIGEAFANQLESLANKWHGQPLREVAPAAPTPKITLGDQRISPTYGVITAVRIVGARVYWKTPAGFGTSTSTQAWRKLPKA